MKGCEEDSACAVCLCNLCIVPAIIKGCPVVAVSRFACPLGILCELISLCWRLARHTLEGHHGGEVQVGRFQGRSAPGDDEPRLGDASSDFCVVQMRRCVVLTLCSLWAVTRRAAARRHLPGKPFGPARQEFADSLAQLLKEDLPTLLLADINFPEEARSSIANGRRMKPCI